MRNLLFLLLFMSGLIVIVVSPAYEGEDEANHYGNIEARIRHSSLYLFDKNTKSIAFQMRRSLAESMSTGDLTRSESLLSKYEEYSSEHINATAYQPPFYYFVFGRIFDYLNMPIHIGLYFMRSVSLFFGLGGIYFLWRSLLLIDISLSEKYITLVVFGLFPVTLGLFTTVSIQPFVFFMFSLYTYFQIRFLLERMQAMHFLLLGAFVSGVTFYSQQIGLLMFGSLLVTIFFAFRNSLLHKAHALAGSMLVLVSLMPGFFAIQELKQDVHYFKTSVNVTVESVSLYAFERAELLFEEIIRGFSGQQRSGVAFLQPLYMQVLFIMILLVGFTQLSMKKMYPLLPILIVPIGLFVGHVVIDFLQFSTSFAHYFKARYLIHGLVSAGVMWTLGMSSHQKSGRKHIFIGGFVLVLWLSTLMNYMVLAWQ